MLFQELATEIVVHIYYSCDSVSDVLALSSTCRRFNYIYTSSQKVPILEHAAEQEFGPLQDANQLLTHNASHPAHLIREVPFSVALLKQIIHVGRVAQKWCDIYPFKKWKVDVASRRLLTSEECYRLRRALYRLWLYSRAFYNSAHPRETRMLKQVLFKRAALLHNWSTPELAEIADVYAMLREVVTNNICPSNGIIARKFKKRFPGQENLLLFNIHLNYPPSPNPAFTPFQPMQYSSPTPNPLSTHFHSTSLYVNHARHAKFAMTRHHEPGGEGWGDDIPHYYVVEDMLKLDPEQILWLKENAPLKSMVEGYVRQLGDWFENNGETWCETFTWVLEERGEDVDEVLEGLEQGRLGVARREA